MSDREQAIRERLARWNTPGLWERADFIVGARDDLKYLLDRVDLAERILTLTHPALENVEMNTLTTRQYMLWTRNFATAANDTQGER